MSAKDVKFGDSARSQMLDEEPETLVSSKPDNEYQADEN